MNPPCFICDHPSVRVCRHPMCRETPFLCDGPCVKEASFKLHCHDEEVDLISIEQLDNKIHDIEAKTDPLVLHREYLECLKKRVSVLKSDLFLRIDEMIKRHENDLMNYCVYQLSEESLRVLSQVERGNEGIHSGRELACLFDEKILFSNKARLEEEFGRLRENVEKTLSVLECPKLAYDTYEEISHQGKTFLEEGKKLIDSKKYQLALLSLGKTRQLIRYDYLVHFRMGYCLERLNRLDEAEHSYKESFSLNEANFDCCNNIGMIYFKRGNFEQALNWYNKALEREGRDIIVITNRGRCYSKLGREAEARQEYERALKMEPMTKKCVERLAEVKREMGKGKS